MSIFLIVFLIFRFIHTIYYSPVQLEFTIILLAAVQVSIDYYYTLYVVHVHVHVCTCTCTCTCTYMSEFF